MAGPNSDSITGASGNVPIADDVIASGGPVGARVQWVKNVDVDAGGAVTTGALAKDLTLTSGNQKTQVTAQPKGAKTVTAPTVTTTAASVLAANSARKAAYFVNPNGATGTIYLGTASVSTSSYTMALAPGNIFVDGDSNDAWYAVTASGSLSLVVTEVA